MRTRTNAIGSVTQAKQWSMQCTISQHRRNWPTLNFLYTMKLEIYEVCHLEEEGARRGGFEDSDDLEDEDGLVDLSLALVLEVLEEETD